VAADRMLDSMDELVEHAPLAILSLDATGTVTSWNRACERLFGWTAAEAVGRPYPLANPAQWEEFLAAIERVATEGTTRFERARHRKDGSEVVIEFTASPLRRADGTFDGVAAVVADVTERRNAERELRRINDELRKSEARFRALIDNALDVTTVLGADGTIAYVSASVERVLGYTPHELEGRNAFQLIHADDNETIRDAFERALHESEPSRADEFRVRHRDGSWRTMESIGVNLSGDPAVAGVLVTLRDITARRELELRLRQVERLEAVGQLAGGVAHDFNNILLVIRGYSSVLEATIEDPQHRADVAEIAKAADRAATLTRRLLAFGRRQARAPQTLYIRDVLADLESLLRRSVREDVELRLEIADEPMPVLADPAQIEQVLLNLVVNARDALGGAGTIVVGVGAAELERVDAGVSPPLVPGRYVALSVADTGCGIPAETLPRIFEPFFTTKEDGLGTGLGLSTVYGIVAQSGGGIGVDSRVGEGTTMTVYLPVATAEIDDVVDAVSETPAAGGGSETILVVEDEDAVRDLVRRVLEQDGYTVVPAGLPSEAESVLAGGMRIDLLITDVVMPEMSGYELAARAREQRPELRTLFMSGYPLGAAGRMPEPDAVLLKKPFAPAELAQVVRTALDQPEASIA
jgi:PAS domain S-box-containing protein